MAEQVTAATEAVGAGDGGEVVGGGEGAGVGKGEGEVGIGVGGEVVGSKVGAQLCSSAQHLVAYNEDSVRAAHSSTECAWLV